MEIDTLKKIIDNSYITQELVSSLNETVNEYGITTNLRLSHFLAQIIHESGGFKYTEEIASGSAYEGRQDLGNINQGDGIKFKGRGLIQLTGRNNYQDLSDAFGINFIKSSQELSPILVILCITSPEYVTDEISISPKEWIANKSIKWKSVDSSTNETSQGSP